VALGEVEPDRLSRMAVSSMKRLDEELESANGALLR